MDQVPLPTDMPRASQAGQHRERKDVAAGEKPDNYTVGDATGVRKLTGFRELLLLVR